MQQVTIELDERDAERLRQATHEPDLAQAVKQVLDGVLAQTEEGTETDEEREAARQRAYEALLSLAGICDLGGDAADNHDHYIYDREA